MLRSLRHKFLPKANIPACMASRRSPTPPGGAGSLGGRALQGAVMTSIMIPAIQYTVWMMLIETPSNIESLSQPSYAWVLVGLIGVLPTLLFLAGVAQATVEVGTVGGIVYVLMVLAGQSLFGQPALAIVSILSLTLGLFAYLGLKSFLNRRRRRRRPRY